MESFNYVCTQLEQVDELLAMLVLLFFVLVIELGLLTRSSHRHAAVASQLLELKKKNMKHKLTSADDQSPSPAVPLTHLNEAADRKTTVKYQVGSGTKGTQSTGQSKKRA